MDQLEQSELGAELERVVVRARRRLQEGQESPSETLAWLLGTLATLTPDTPGPTPPASSSGGQSI